jgi:hypothetical protein
MKSSTDRSVSAAIYRSHIISTLLLRRTQTAENNGRNINCLTANCISAKNAGYYSEMIATINSFHSMVTKKHLVNDFK